MRIEVALAAMGDLLVQACKLYLAFAALDTSDRIAGVTAFRICRADLEHLFPTVFILPTIHSGPPFIEQAYQEKAYIKPWQSNMYACELRQIFNGFHRIIQRGRTVCGISLDKFWHNVALLVAGFREIIRLTRSSLPVSFGRRQAGN